MANTNGHASPPSTSADLVFPSDFAIFRIGGKDIAVPEPTLGILKELRPEIDSLGPGQNRLDYASTVIKIISICLRETAPELTEEVLTKYCSSKEMLNLAPSMNKLLEISGLLGETQAVDEESPGTGTSTALQPNLPSEGSAAETPSA